MAALQQYQALSPWLAQLAALPAEASLPSPMDVYDPKSKLLLLKQGYPVNQQLLGKLLQFGIHQPPSVTPEIAPAVDTTTQPQPPSISSSLKPRPKVTLDKLLVVEPDPKASRNVLARLIQASVAPGKIMTIPALSMVDTAVERLRPSHLFLAWTFTEENPQALWDLLRQLKKQFPKLQVAIMATCPASLRSHLPQWQAKASLYRANFITKPLIASELQAIL